ncbi:hypothetical protein ES705_27368 [subsurface metagenome]
MIIVAGAFSLKIPTKGSYLHIMKWLSVAAKSIARARYMYGTELRMTSAPRGILTG